MSGKQPVEVLLRPAVEFYTVAACAGAENENLERQEGYRNPINHFEKLQWFAPNIDPASMKLNQAA